MRDAGCVNASTKEVHCYVALAQSRNAQKFKDHGYVLSWKDRSVWGYGDEIFPLGAYRVNGKYNVYHVAKGSVGAWKLGVATGFSPFLRNHNTRPLVARSHHKQLNNDDLTTGVPYWGQLSFSFLNTQQFVKSKRMSDRDS